MKIIIVDDERNSLENLHMKMKQIPQITGIEVFQNPLSAFTYASRNPVDIAFLDIEMPEMTGIEMAQQLKSINPKLNIIFVTAYDNYAINAFELKASDYLMKPTTVESIQNAIKNLRHPVSRPSEYICMQTFPFLHRSGDFIFNSDENRRILEETIGTITNEEYNILDELINAGLAYERGSLSKAYKLALSANVKLKDGFALEIQFCSHMILTAILDAQGHHAEALKILNAAMTMIETHKAYYLNENFQAFSCHFKLSYGDAEAAVNWLKQHSAPPYETLSFYKMYQHFTTARAYISVGDCNMAILFLKKLQILCEQYQRPLDIIEVNILLAIAYWKKVRGQQNDAFEPLEKAIILSREYGYTQIFANEGAALSTMLHKLQKRSVQKDYYGGLSSTEVKTLYTTALAREKHSWGLTGAKMPETLTFTNRQKTVMHYLSEGLTQKEIGERMGLKPSAIKSHMILIYKKLDVSNGVDAIIKMQKLGILDK